MKAIAAVDLNWGIGYKGKLLQRIPEDMKYFKQMTLGKVVVMGRETLESLPGTEPLSGRTNIVLTASRHFSDDRFIVCRSLEQLFAEIKKYNSDDVFVIGGESVYSQLLPYCTEAYITRINKAYEADKYFPDLDKLEDWKCKSAGDINIYNGIEFRFCRYIKNR